MTRGGISQGVGKSLQGGGAGDYMVWVRNVGPFGVTEFLQMITGKRAKKLGDGTWETPGAEGIQESAGTQSDRIYIERRQATVAQWVALSPVFEVCAMETGYVGVGRRRKV